MAEIRDELILDIARALREVDQLERAIDQALGSVEIAIDTTAARQQLDTLARQADQALSDVDVDIDTTGASRLNTELAGVERNLTEADREADQLTGSLRGAARAADDMETSSGRIATAFTSLKTGAAGIIAGFGAFAAIRGAIGFATDAKDAFAALQDSANATKVVFGDAVGTIEQFGETVAQSAGLSTAEFNQAAAILGSSLLNVGFGAEEAAQRTVELTQRAADMASIFGGPVNDALGAIQAALRGETDPIERFGVGLSAAAVEARAAALGFSAVDGELDNTAKAAARLDLILEQTARTAGDFANTSGDLANAQKVAAAEFENAKASLGEALLPVFQSLLEIAPAVVASLEQLAPSLQAFAVSLGNVLEHREGALDLLDVLQGFADLPRAFGALGTILSAPFLGAAEASQQFTEQINTQGLIDDLRAGGDAATELANRLAKVGQEGELNPQFIRDLTRIAGTDVRRTADALRAVVQQGVALGLTAPEIRNVAVALAQLLSAGESSEAERAMARLAIANDEVAASGAPAVSALQELQTAATEAGLSMGDLIAGVDPVAEALFNSLTPAEQLALKLEGVRTGAVTVADAFTSNLTPSLIDVQRGLEDLNKNGSVSMAEFVTNLSNARAEFLQFQIDIAAIANISPELAAALQALGPEAAGDLAEGFANLNPDEIIAQADAAGLTDTFEKAVLGVFVAGVGQVDGNDPRAVDAYIALVEDLFGSDIPGIGKIIAAAFQPALNTSFADLTPPAFDPIVLASVEGLNHAQITASLDEALNASFADVVLDDPTDTFTAALEDMNAAEIAAATEAALNAGMENVNVDLFLLGLEAGLTFADGVSAGISGQTGNLEQTITQTINGAIQRQSPPKLFLDAGVDSGEAFWLGFEQADLTMRTPTMPVSGAVGATTTAGSGGGGGFTFAPTYIDTSTRDLETVVARSEQTMAAVAGLVNGRINLR